MFVSSPDELIASSMHGQDVLRFMGRSLDLLPQLRHEVIDRPCRRRLLVAPDLIEDLLSGHHLTGMRDEIPEQIEFSRGEVDPLPCAVRLMGAKVDFDVADAA